MSFCFLYNVVSENYSVQNSPRGGEGGLLPAQSLQGMSILNMVHICLSIYHMPYLNFVSRPKYASFVLRLPASNMHLLCFYFVFPSIIYFISSMFFFR